VPQFFKSKCYKCSGGIEFPEEGIGQTVTCPHCGQKTKLGLNPFAKPLHEQTSRKLPLFKCDPAPADLPPPVLKQKRARIPLSQLTEVTIRSKTQSADTPLHRAAKNGEINAIPTHLLRTELFMVKNNAGETPLHVAARHGHLDQVPPQFLTKETLTTTTSPHYAPNGVYFTGSGYEARTETVLHVAARCGHAEQIPKEFLSPEFLSIEAPGYRTTVLHELAYSQRLDLVPDIYTDSEMWNLRDSQGRTARDILKDVQPTPRQLATLQKMGIAFDETLTREMAADLIETEHEKRRQGTRMSLNLFVENPPGSVRAVGPPIRVTLLAKSSSRESPYKVDFMADGPSIRVFCHCQAGVKRWMCKHKLALINGDSNMLFDPRQNELLAQIQLWPQYNDLKTRIQEFQNKVREIEEASNEEYSKFCNWLESHNKKNQKDSDDVMPSIQFYIGFGDDDPEVQEKLEDLYEAKAELKRKWKTIKEDFMLGLTMGFHRVKKATA
jgi:hypothetical protein